jgi:hypothetical protein
MFSVCVCAFFCVCVQVEAWWRADHPPKESYRLSMIRKQKPKWNGEFHGGRPRPTGAVVPIKKNRIWGSHDGQYEDLYMHVVGWKSTEVSDKHIAFIFMFEDRDCTVDFQWNTQRYIPEDRTLIIFLHWSDFTGRALDSWTTVLTRVWAHFMTFERRDCERLTYIVACKPVARQFPRNKQLPLPASGP